ncbi:diacylglycerol kinase family protein [Bizionia sediminis]|uniref:Diacylglycerol kinase family protein n=1 Tax=Bizionia sediminis TaxID=1737064 RepID=A0ABW5KTF1_9FLAO
MPKKESFIINRLKSIAYAVNGACILIRTEASLQVQIVIGFIVTFAGYYYAISPTEWLIQIGVIGIVIALEGLNTAIEKLADFVHPHQHKEIGVIKDIAAGAVFLFAIIAIIMGLIIYIPKVFKIHFGLG